MESFAAVATDSDDADDTIDSEEGVLHATG